MLNIVFANRNTDVSSPADDITTSHPILFDTPDIVFSNGNERKRSFLQIQIMPSLYSDVKYTQLMMIDNDLKLSKMI